MNNVWEEFSFNYQSAIPFDPLEDCPQSSSLNMHRKLYYYTHFADVSIESGRFADFLKGTEIIKHGFRIRSQVFRPGQESSRIGIVEKLAAGVPTCPSPLCINTSVTSAWGGGEDPK